MTEIGNEFAAATTKTITHVTQSPNILALFENQNVVNSLKAHTLHLKYQSWKSGRQKCRTIGS